MDDATELNNETKKQYAVIIPFQDKPTYQKNPDSVWKYIKLQTIASTVITLSMMHAGMTISFPNLLNNHLEDSVISSFASISALSTPIGSCMTSLLTDRIGRKRTLLTIEFLSIVTWIMASFAYNSVFLYICSVFSGMTRGALTSHCAAFVSEITHNDYRQMFLSFTTLFFTIGYCLTSIVNVWLHWTQAGWFFAFIFSILAVFTIFLVPESPHWLAVMKLDLRRAKNTLKKYNPQVQMFEKEWSVIQLKLQSNDNRNSKARCTLIRDPSVYKPSIILLTLLLIQQACGIYPLSAYVTFILPKISKSLGGDYKSEIFVVLSLIRLVISILTTIFLSKFNQKQLLSTSFIGMLVFSIPIMIIKMLESSEGISNEALWHDWVSVSSVVLFTTFGCVGALGIPWTIIFELLPTEVRGFLGPYFVAFGYVVMAGFFKTFLTIFAAIGVFYTFLILGLVSLVGSVFIQWCVPETRGKSLFDIENRFSNKPTETKS